MNLTMGTTPRPGFEVVLWDDTRFVGDDEPVPAFRVQVTGPGGENMDGEPFDGTYRTIVHDEARRFANVAHRLIRRGHSADEAYDSAMYDAIDRADAA